MLLHDWAAKHQIPYAALKDLMAIIGILADEAAPKKPPPARIKTETDVMNYEVTKFQKIGGRAFRNNVGAFENANGQWVRFGLGNDSARANDLIKSADLIGCKPVLIGHEHVGMLFGQFWCREAKEPGWTYSGDEREKAQLLWALTILSMGGDAAFTDGSSDFMPSGART